MLDIKGMARSTFYYGLKERPDKHEEVRKHIRRIYETHKGRYGYRRVQMELEAEGVHINHKTVQKLMNEMGLKGIRKKRKYKSYRGKVGHVAPNLLHRDFHAESPLQKCATDVTQISVDGKWCYFSPVIDMFNGEIISYTISDRPNLKMVTSMLYKVFKAHPHLKGMLLHSDQGWQYQHPYYQQLLLKKGIVQSMSRKGNCLDNSVMENFFGLMKNELLYNNQFGSMEEFKIQLRKYIHYYNNQRIKLKLKMNPVQYRLNYVNNHSINKV